LSQGFLGSPPMNLLAARAGRDFPPSGLCARAPADGWHAAPSSSGSAGGHAHQCARARDLEGEVFSSELLGDAALVTLRAGSDLVIVKAEKDCPVRMGDMAGITFDRAAVHLFDGATGQRYRGAR
jgi:multiple sugar transport system ATP-binding protein